MVQAALALLVHSETWQRTSRAWRALVVSTQSAKMADMKLRQRYVNYLMGLGALRNCVEKAVHSNFVSLFHYWGVSRYERKQSQLSQQHLAALCRMRSGVGGELDSQAKRHAAKAIGSFWTRHGRHATKVHLSSLIAEFRRNAHKTHRHESQQQLFVRSVLAMTHVRLCNVVVQRSAHRCVYWSTLAAVATWHAQMALWQRNTAKLVLLRQQGRHRAHGLRSLIYLRVLRQFVTSIFAWRDNMTDALLLYANLLT